MEKFRYSAYNDAGDRVSGTEVAASQSAAHLALLERGLQSVDLTQKKSVLQFEITRKKVPRKDLMHFSRQLGVFVKAGIPIMEALEVIGAETTDKALKATIFDMIERLQAGDTFGAAAAAHPEAFPDFYIGILGSAELTGTLDLVLDQLADYIDRDIEARGKVSGALIYPGVVAVMAVVTVVILATFVLPRFKVFFASFNVSLPLPTRMMLAASGFVSTWWWALLLGMIGIVVTITVLRRTDGGQAWLDSVLLRRPGRGRHDAGRHHGADLPHPLVHGARRRVVARGHGRDRSGGEQCGLPARAPPAREEMMEGQGLSDPIARMGLFPERPARCSGWERRRGRSTSSWSWPRRTTTVKSTFA